MTSNAAPTPGAASATPAAAPVPTTQATAPQTPKMNIPQAKVANVQAYIKAARAQNIPDSTIYGVLAQKGYIASSAQAPTKPSGIAAVPGNITSDVEKSGQQVHDAVAGEGQYAGDNPITRGFEAVGAAAGAIPAVAADVIPGGKAALGAIGKATQAATGFAGNVTDELNQGAEKLGLESPEQVKNTEAEDSSFANSGSGKAIEQVAKTGNAAGNVANTILGAEGAAKGIAAAPATVKGVAQAADAVGGKVVDNMAKNPLVPEVSVPKMGNGAITDPKALDQHIVDTYTKAIKPTITGKTKNVGQMAQYNKNVATGVRSIVGNKDALDLRDEFGDPTGHPLPKTISQFGQAISQAKNAIFNKYDSLAKAAGDKGADVQLNPIADELEKIGSDKVTNDLHPDLASYANARAATLRERGSYSMSDAGKAVQNLNKTLESFYRNPSYETASRASVDALMANKMRTALDDAVSATTDTGAGEGYQNLKNQYGALRSIENDVVKRGVVEARQTGGRGLSFGDVTSAEEVIKGLAHMDPKSLAIGGAIKGVQALKRYLTDPNRAVSNLFDTVDKSTNTAATAP